MWAVLYIDSNVYIHICPNFHSTLHSHKPCFPPGSNTTISPRVTGLYDYKVIYTISGTTTQNKLLSLGVVKDFLPLPCLQAPRLGWPRNLYPSPLQYYQPLSRVHINWTCQSAFSISSNWLPSHANHLSMLADQLVNYLSLQVTFG